MKSRRINKIVKTFVISSAIAPAITTVIACGDTEETPVDKIATYDGDNLARPLFMDTVIDFLDEKFSNGTENFITISPHEFEKVKDKTRTTEEREAFVSEKITSYITDIYTNLLNDKNTKKNGTNFRGALYNTQYKPTSKTNPLLDKMLSGLTKTIGKDGETYLSQITNQIYSEIQSSATTGGTDADFRQPFVQTVDLALKRSKYKEYNEDGSTKNVTFEDINYQLNINFKFELTNDDLEDAVSAFANTPDTGFSKAVANLPKDAANKPYLEIVHDFGAAAAGEKMAWPDAAIDEHIPGITSIQKQVQSWFTQVIRSDSAFQSTIDTGEVTNKFSYGIYSIEPNKDLEITVPPKTTGSSVNLGDPTPLKVQLQFRDNKTQDVIKTQDFEFNIALVNTEEKSEYVKTLLQASADELNDVYDEIKVEEMPNLMTIYADKNGNLGQIASAGANKLNILGNYYMEKLRDRPNFSIAKNVDFKKSHLIFKPVSPLDPQKTQITYDIELEAYGINFLTDFAVVSPLTGKQVVLNIADPADVDNNPITLEGGVVTNTDQGIDSQVGNNVLSFLTRSGENDSYRENVAYENTLKKIVSKDDISTSNILDEDYLRLLSYMNNFTRWSYDNIENAEQLRTKGALTFSSLFSNGQNLARSQADSGSDYQNLGNETEITLSRRNHMALELIQDQISQILAARPELNETAFANLQLTIPYPSKYGKDSGQIKISGPLKVSMDDEHGIRFVPANYNPTNPNETPVNYAYDKQAIVNAYANATHNFNPEYFNGGGRNQFVQPLVDEVLAKKDDAKEEMSQSLSFNFDIGKLVENGQPLVQDMETFNTYYAPLIRYLSGFANPNAGTTTGDAPYTLATFLPSKTNLGNDLYNKLDMPSADDYTKFANYLLKNANTGADNNAYIEVMLRSGDTIIGAQRLYLEDTLISDDQLKDKTDQWAIENLITRSETIYLNNNAKMTDLFPNFERAEVGDPDVNNDVDETTLGMYDYTSLLLTDVLNLFFNNPLA